MDGESDIMAEKVCDENRTRRRLQSTSTISIQPITESIHTAVRYSFAAFVRVLQMPEPVGSID